MFEFLEPHEIEPARYLMGVYVYYLKCRNLELQFQASDIDKETLDIISHMRGCLEALKEKSAGKGKK